MTLLPPVLTKSQATDVAQLAQSAEDTLGARQDIEWAFDEDGLHIL